MGRSSAPLGQAVLSPSLDPSPQSCPQHTPRTPRQAETTAAREPALPPPRLLAPPALGAAGPGDSLESHTDEGAKLHVHLCVCGIVRHVHSLNCLEGRKMWLLPPRSSASAGAELRSRVSSTAERCPPQSPPVHSQPHPVPPTSITRAEAARQFPFVPLPSRGSSGRLPSTSLKGRALQQPPRKQPRYRLGWGSAHPVKQLLWGEDFAVFIEPEKMTAHSYEEAGAPPQGGEQQLDGHAGAGCK